MCVCVCVCVYERERGEAKTIDCPLLFIKVWPNLAVSRESQQMHSQQTLTTTLLSPSTNLPPFPPNRIPLKKSQQPGSLNLGYFIGMTNVHSYRQSTYANDRDVNNGTNTLFFSNPSHLPVAYG